MERKTLAAALLLLIPTAVSATATDAAAVLESLSVCTHEASALNRLDCYDNILRPQQQAAVAQAAGAMSPEPNWQQAFKQEQDRQENAPRFLTTHSGGENPRVMLTTPALGRFPVRPLLVFSCIDNITRMQIMLPEPMRLKKGMLTLVTDKGSLRARWFVRSEGYMLEASRGLPGIDEIRQLLGFQASRVTVSADDPVMNGLIFDISTLPEAIKPLRAACRW